MLKRRLIELLLLPLLFVLFFWAAFELPRIYDLYFGIGARAEFDHGATIAGNDADSNGVRDDVDAYIRRTFPDPQRQAAALQFARALQAALLVSLHDPDAVRLASASISDSISCIFSRFPGYPDVPDPAQVSEELRKITVNTRLRWQAYDAYNRALSGSVFSLPDHDTCE